MLTLKEEYKGEILEIRTDEVYIKFDTNVEPESTYEYFYGAGFDWAFDKI